MTYLFLLCISGQLFFHVIIVIRDRITLNFGYYMHRLLTQAEILNLYLELRLEQVYFSWICNIHALFAEDTILGFMFAGACSWPCSVLFVRY